MTYRERREQKAERLREWAAKRAAKSESAFNQAHQIADGIPMGQPILVGHHSEGRARRDQDRIYSNMSKGVESQRMAERMSEKADNIEKAAEHAIYSDDEDAVDRLKERIAGLEAERASIKAYNASCRKGARDVDLLDKSQQENLVSIAKYASFQLGKNGEFPSYALSNLSGNINRQKKRLAELEAKL